MSDFKEGDIVRVIDVNGAFRKPPPNLISRISKISATRVNLNRDLYPPPMGIFGPGRCGHVYRIKDSEFKADFWIGELKAVLFAVPSFDDWEF